MTALDESPSIEDLDGGPHDIEFFFDPGCPFAWQTSVWVRRVMELRDIKVGWRFISLLHINRDKDLPQGMRDAQERSLRYHRICAAARERFGNDVVGQLYQAWGERLWYQDIEGDFVAKYASATKAVDPAEIV